MIKNSGHVPRERIAEDFVWAQWDMAEQRLYYIDLKVKASPVALLFIGTIEFLLYRYCNLLVTAFSLMVY